jgi:hypothetical protein
MQTAIKSENVLRVEAMKILIEYLGSVNTERFINSIKADHFDYTKWQKNLWEDKTIDEIHQRAADFYNSTHRGTK